MKRMAKTGSCLVSLLLFVALPARAQDQQPAGGVTPLIRMLPMPASFNWPKDQQPGESTSRQLQKPVDDRGPALAVRPKLGKAFWIPWGIAFGLMIADAELTTHCLKLPNCAEGNPLFGEKPSRLRIYGIKLAAIAPGFYLSQKWKRYPKGNSWGWNYIPAAMIGNNGFAVVFNLAQGFPRQKSVAPQKGAVLPMIANMPASEVVPIRVR
jgi:hypothetical protein